MDTMISVVIPAFNEADSIPELYEQICDALSEIPEGAERQLVFVDDGSTDGTARRIEMLSQGDPTVCGISFERNRGKAAALMAGFAAAEGELVFTMDADLQDDPAEMPRFVQKLNEGYDLVVGWKQERQDTAEKRTASRLFNGVVSRTFGIPLHDFDCGFKLFRREVTRELELEGGLYRFIPVYVAQSGYRVTELPYHHRTRKYGHSKYGLKRYFEGLRDYLRVLWQTKVASRGLLPANPEVIRYAVAGVLTTLINLGGFQLLCLMGIDYKVSNAIALVCCKLFAFVANKLYVFRSKSASTSQLLREAGLYAVTRGLTGLLDFLLLILFADVFRWDKAISKLGIQALVILANYFVGKYVVFGDRRGSSSRQEY